MSSASEGSGQPNTDPLYTAGRETRPPGAYGLKGAGRGERDHDYVVPPLEGLWWAEHHEVFTTSRDKRAWSWTMMLLIPAWIPEGMPERVAADVSARRGLPRAADLRISTLEEGRCMQTLHLGGYDEEGPVLEAMHRDFAPAHGVRLRGTHHEIYLSDPRRTAPEKLKTILRQPVEPM